MSECVFGDVLFEINSLWQTTTTTKMYAGEDERNYGGNNLVSRYVHDVNIQQSSH